MSEGKPERFQLVSNYQPTGDQPQAIQQLVKGLNTGMKEQTLLGVTGSGKTFTMANVIAQVNRPTLVLAHNKTLAAQLCSEFREFFPNNAVEYFVSYYDYYQPEAYIPQTDTYIEKDSAINDEIDKLRHSATSALSERRDVIIVASVSCIYSLGDPIDYRTMVISLRPGMEKDRDELLKKLVELQYERNDVNFIRNKFRVRGDVVEIFPANATDKAVRVEFFGDEIDRLTEFNPLTGDAISELKHIAIYPASHYIVPKEKMDKAIRDIEREMEQRVDYFKSEGKLIEAQRIEQRTRYDMEMLQEIGFCKGIENYSRVLSGREPGSAPFTLIDYFPEDFVLFVDESHVTLPQVRGMYAGDRARKEMLVNYGFRLPSAFDNRPFGPQDHRQAHGRPNRRFDFRNQPAGGEGRAGAGDHPDQENGRGPDGLPGGLRHQGAVHAPRHRHCGAHGDHPGPAPGRVRRSRWHQPAAGGPGHPRGVPGGHFGRGQGGLPAQRPQPHPDHRPRRPERGGPGHHVRRRGDPLHGAGHHRDGAPPGHPGEV